MRGRLAILGVVAALVCVQERMFRNGRRALLLTARPAPRNLRAWAASSRHGEKSTPCGGAAMRMGRRGMLVVALRVPS